MTDFLLNSPRPTRLAPLVVVLIEDDHPVDIGALQRSFKEGDAVVIASAEGWLEAAAGNAVISAEENSPPFTVGWWCCGDSYWVAGSSTPTTKYQLYFGLMSQDSKVPTPISLSQGARGTIPAAMKSYAKVRPRGCVKWSCELWLHRKPAKILLRQGTFRSLFLRTVPLLAFVPGCAAAGLTNAWRVFDAAPDNVAYIAIAAILPPLVLLVLYLSVAGLIFHLAPRWLWTLDGWNE
jgi:hypothetical protein